MADENGNPNTLGEWRDFWNDVIHGGQLSSGTAFLDQKIADSPAGRDDVVIAHESQMFYLLAQMDRRETNE